jgi:hypothetical protein
MNLQKAAPETRHVVISSFFFLHIARLTFNFDTFMRIFSGRASGRECLAGTAVRQVFIAFLGYTYSATLSRRQIVPAREAEQAAEKCRTAINRHAVGNHPVRRLTDTPPESGGEFLTVPLLR